MVNIETFSTSYAAPIVRQQEAGTDQEVGRLHTLRQLTPMNPVQLKQNLYHISVTICAKSHTHAHIEYSEL